MGVLIQVKRRPSALGPLPVRRVPPDYCYVFMDAAMTTSRGNTPRTKWRTPAKAGAAVGAVRQHQQCRQNAMSQQQAEQEQSSAANAYGQAYAECMAAKGFPDR